MSRAVVSAKPCSVNRRTATAVSSFRIAIWVRSRTPGGRGDGSPVVVTAVYAIIAVTVTKTVTAQCGLAGPMDNIEIDCLGFVKGVSMARTHNDTWDLASSVGATATMVAAARAVATKSGDPLIDDPFAEPLVKAVGVDFFARLAAGELDPADIDDGAVLGVQRMTDGMAVRTVYFDEFAEAGKVGIRQVVILASGLDSRAYRLPWPAGTTLFEIDQPQVIEFKTVTLADLGAVATADRRGVAR